MYLFLKTSLEGATSAAASPGSQPIRSSTDAAFTLFYGKFRSQAPRVTKVLGAIEERVANLQQQPSSTGEAAASPGALLWQEYESVLSDCHAIYFSCRVQLLTPSVRSAIAEMAGKYRYTREERYFGKNTMLIFFVRLFCRKDHCGLVRAGCAFLLHVCEDEYHLFHQFFQRESDSLRWEKTQSYSRYYIRTADGSFIYPACSWRACARSCTTPCAPW